MNKSAKVVLDRVGRCRTIAASASCEPQTQNRTSAARDAVGGKADIAVTSADFRFLSSGPEDFHLRALPEPYVNLSIHTAPVVRPLP
jgi:hypothetical protein